MRVKKRGGQLVKFRSEKIAEAIERAAESVEKTAKIELLVEQITQRINKEHQTVVLIEEVQDIVEDTLVKNNLTDIARAYMLYRRKKQEEREAKTAILGQITKTDFSLNAIKLLHDKYLLRDDTGKIIENPDEMFDRVASAAAEAEEEFSKDEKIPRRWKNRFKRSMQNLDFLPSTTILINAGLPDKQFAASTGFKINDNLREIFSTLGNAVDMQRKGSGTGFNFSRIRERYADVHQHRKISGGPLEFLHVYNEALGIILQNGRRHGANMAILNVHHPDVLDFISAKVKEYKLTNFNISVALSEEFMRAAILDREYDLKSPYDKKAIRTMYAKQVFDIIVASAWNYADPGVLFMDKIAKDNPMPEAIATTSACAEFMLNEYECGFISSINLANFVIKETEKTQNDKGQNSKEQTVEKAQIDYKRLRDTVFLGVRFLDNIISINDFPLKESKKIVEEQRKIGLGVMGWAHMLFQLKIPYDSDEAIEKAKELMSFIRGVADEASFELSQERGVFPSWKKSVYGPKKGSEGMPLRNATRLAIAPTGSISIIANTSSSIEPVYALSYVKHIVGGKELSYVDPYLKEALEEEGILTNELIEKIINHGLLACEEIPEEIKRVFVTTHQISPEYHVRMQAAFQESVDNGVSKTVNLPYDATLLDVENVFMLAYKLGCKGVTVYRDGSKQQQVLELTTLMQKRSEQRRIHSVREELRVQLSNKSLDDFQQ